MTDRIDTICVQGGYRPGNGEPRQIPIVQSTTFKYDTSEDMGKLFDLEAQGYFYSRLQNPTCDAVAAKIAALEGGTMGMLTSSGQAANFYAVFNIASCGDHVVASNSIYGGTYNLFSVTMKKMGIDFTFVSPDCTAVLLPEEAFVFLGDAPCGDFYGRNGEYDPKLLEKMLSFLQTLPVNRCCTGHGEPESLSELIQELEEEARSLTKSQQ